MTLLEIYRINSYLHLKEYDSGFERAEIVDNSALTGTNNWMTYKEYHFLLCMHSKRYEKAEEVIKRVTSHDRYKYSSESRIELWNIFSAFVYLVLKANPKSKAKLKYRKEPFRLFKFLNEIPIYEKDKRGLNISILVLQILLLFDKRHAFLIIDRIESINLYSKRYLRKDAFYRSNCFIRMLSERVKHDFDFKLVQEKTETFFNKLKGERLSYRGTHEDIEIIPYEHLWEFVLEKLKRRNR